MQLKNQPFAQHEKGAIKLLLKKWKNTYKQRDLAHAFLTAWVHEGTFLCRVSLNETGGIPNDNNGLEATNGTQKRENHFERYAVTTFVSKFPAYLQNVSAEDTGMALTMSFTNESVDTWNTNFFLEW